MTPGFKSIMQAIFSRCSQWTSFSVFISDTFDFPCFLFSIFARYCFLVVHLISLFAMNAWFSLNISIFLSCMAVTVACLGGYARMGRRPFMFLSTPSDKCDRIQITELLRLL